MKITFWGAVGETTGSRMLLEVQGRRALFDCGLFQGHREEAEARNRRFPFDVRELTAVVLSHAHLDHSGNLPGLVRDGYRGPIHATHATVDLLDPMLRDSAHIQERDVVFVNKRRARKRQPPKTPVYTLAHAEETLPLLRGHDYHEPFTVMPGIEARFFDAGHILGSALTVLDLEEGGKRRRLCFTGDLGRRQAIIRDPERVPEIDGLVIESTYGNRLHEEPARIPDIMTELLNRVYERGGKIIIPAFAVGRTQEVVLMLKLLFESGRVPEMPVYVDSPLAIDVTTVFRRHEECYDAETQALLRDEHTDPFGFRRMRYVRDVAESMALNTRPGPMIIIAASGMCEAGRVLHHLRNNIGDPRTLVLIVSFQAENTLGRRLEEEREEVHIFGETFQRRAEVRALHAFSAHADRDELLAWVRKLEEGPRTCFIVHGEPESARDLAEALRGERIPATLPELGQPYLL